MTQNAQLRQRDPSSLGLRSVASDPMVSAPPATISPERAPRITPWQLRPHRREWLVAHEGWLGFAGLTLSCAVVALFAARTDLLLPESVRWFPGSLAGVFGHGGINLGMGGLIAVLSVMFVSYIALVRGAHQLSARPVLIGIACLNLLVLLAPPLLSTDIFSYMAYGRIGAVYGFNPYFYGPLAIRLDPLYQFISAQWVTTPTAYGPLFTVLSYAFAPLTIAANVVAYKSIAAISSLAIVLLVWNTARLRGLNPVKAVAIVGLNPVIVVYGVGGGHNDLLMLAILLAGVYVLLQQKPRASGALIVTAAAVKLTAGLLLPFALAQSARERSGALRRRSLLTGAGAAATVFVVLSFAAFGTGPLHLVATLQTIQSQGGLHSIPGIVLAGFGHVEAMSVVGVVLEVVLVASLVWLVRRVWKGELDWITGAGWATVAMLSTASLLVPWYVAWVVPLAALSRDRRLLVVTVMLTGLALTTL